MEDNTMLSHNFNEPEKGGLVPITAAIFNKLEVSQENKPEFQGVQITDITAVGYLVDYKEEEKKTVVTLYDYTGLLRVSFFKRGEEELNLFNETPQGENRQPVKIFGTLRYYNKFYIQGAKLIPTSCNNILYHKANVIHAWLYLTGKLGDNKENYFSEKKSEMKSETKNSSSGGNDEDIAINILSKFSQNNNNNVVTYFKMDELLQKFGGKKKDIISKLVEEGRLIETEDGYEIY